MASDDKTKTLLKELLANLYSQQAEHASSAGQSYLIAADDQFLGNITDNAYDSNSLLNTYGPYGSPYSPTSIFNMYSPYGSPYGQFSLRNSYSTQPPKLFLNGRFRGNVSENQYIQDRIPAETFLYSLQHNIQGLLHGNLMESETAARALRKESFIVSSDETYLGSLDTNRYSRDSVFNQFGPYGSRFSPTSIFNSYSPYGSLFSALSAFNPHAASPPEVYQRGQRAGHLTVSVAFPDRIDPSRLREWIDQVGP